MKLRTVIFLLIVLPVVSILNPLTSSAQEPPVYMYWTDVQTYKIQRANLDGTNVQDLVTTDLIRPDGIALDLAGGKMYWTGAVWGANPPLNKIQRANLDGTNIEDLLINVGTREGITVDSVGGKMYWVNEAHDKIQRANFDGTNIEDLVTTGLNSPTGITLDVIGGKMYWTDRDTGKIQRANLDGTNIEDLITTGLQAPINIALDLAGGKMYWTDWGTDKIQRANLDGTNIEDLITTGLIGPDGIALHLAAGKMYWADWGTSSIRRANLDGTDVENLITTGLRGSAGIALGIPESPRELRFNPNVIADQTFVVNTPIEPLALPVATGGAEPYTYTLEPLPNGLAFDAAARVLSGTPTTTGTTLVTYTATDATGASASLTFTIEVIEDGTGPGDDALDVNGDGQITVVDLAITALFYGTQVPVGISLPADVNTDGVVNLLDLTAVAQGIDAAGGLNQLSLQEVKAALLAAAELKAIAGAPMGFGTRVLSGSVTYGNVAAALASVSQMAAGDVHLRKGVAVLEGLLRLLAEMGAIPETTALLPNYPNPFNPETWIPYHLATDTEVIVTIYDMRGASVRELVLGHQTAGVYESRGRAAYWDGRNRKGEPVASGVYFYTLTAGDFTATRKLMIRK